MVSIAQERVGKGPTPPYVASTLLVLSQSFSRVCCLSLFPMGKSANKKNTKKRKLDDKAHYCCMSASQRAAQYPGVMEARGDTMWCIHCEVPVQHSHPNTHIKSGKHQRKSNSPSKPDFGAAEGTPPSSDATIEEPVHTFASTSDRTVIIDAINEDVIAALLGAGIPLEKIDHPSFRGVLRTYTTVEGCIREASNLRKKANLQPLYDTHLAAIRRRLHRPRLKYVPHAWLSFDERTDDFGNAIVDVILGVGRECFVIETATLECKGPNLGVEHSELVSVLVDTLGRLGISPQDIGFFITDGASVVKAAITAALPVFLAAIQVICLAHTLNNCAKAMLGAAGFQMVSNFYTSARSFVNAKLHAARRRRWYAFLKARGTVGH